MVTIGEFKLGKAFSIGSSALRSRRKSDGAKKAIKMPVTSNTTCCGAMSGRFSGVMIEPRGSQRHDKEIWRSDFEARGSQDRIQSHDLISYHLQSAGFDFKAAFVHIIAHINIHRLRLDYRSVQNQSTGTCCSCMHVGFLATAQALTKCRDEVNLQLSSGVR